jgi:hydroxymethylpyrimidine pyrophosphatase-like HAD family hydrolase
MKTIFCDIDGTLCIHHEDIVRQHSEELQLLPETIEVLKQWERSGHRIILTTGRKKSHRKQLESQLRNAGIFWDELIMGLSNGPRVIVNDVKKGGEDRALSCNVARNKGIGELMDL